MVDLAPFRALRYDPAVAGPPAATSAPPLDDLDPYAYAGHRTASPYTVLELIAGGGDYASAGATYRRWRRTGVLRLDPRPALYRYELHELRRGSPAVMRGLVGALAVEPLGRGVVGHEQVEPARAAARRARLAAVPVDLAPVLLLAAPLPPEVRALLTAPPSSSPLAAFTDDGGIDHRLWALPDPAVAATVAAALADVRLVVADGHHRYAAALATRGPGGPAARTLALVADATVDGPRLAPVHRILAGVGDDPLARVGPGIGARPAPADPEALAGAVADAPAGSWGLRLPGGRAWLLSATDVAGLADTLPRDHSARWRRLDAALLEQALAPRLGATVTVHGGDLAAAAAAVDASADAALVVVHPADVDDVVALARVGELLPPKSTSFRPKPRSGLVLRPLDG